MPTMNMDHGDEKGNEHPFVARRSSRDVSGGKESGPELRETNEKREN
jgi:hypothetical protein